MEKSTKLPLELIEAAAKLIFIVDNFTGDKIWWKQSTEVKDFYRQQVENEFNTSTEE